MNVRDWLFVEDHCSAIRTVLEKGRIGETYNIGGNSERDKHRRSENHLRSASTKCARKPGALREEI